jgi:hypothetical protein
VTPLSLTLHLTVCKIVYSLAVRLPITKFSHELLAILHGHLALPVRPVLINRTNIHYSILKLDADGTDRHALDELPLENPSFSKDDISHSGDILHGEDRLLEQHSIVTIFALQKF